MTKRISELLHDRLNGVRDDSAEVEPTFDWADLTQADITTLVGKLPRLPFSIVKYAQDKLDDGMRSRGFIEDLALRLPETFGALVK